MNCYETRLKMGRPYIRDKRLVFLLCLFLCHMFRYSKEGLILVLSENSGTSDGLISQR